MQAVGFFTCRCISIASFWSQFQDGLSAAERVFALIDAEPKVVQTGAAPVRAAERPDRVPGRATSPTPDKEIVLPSTSPSPSGPRETIALVGHTGAGKSSIARLVGALLRVPGRRAAGRRARHPPLDLAQYRRHLGFVPQEPFLFSGTVRDNIRYGRPDATDEDVRRAAVRHRRRRLAGRACPRAWTPTWASAGPTSRWASGSWSRWRACCCKDPAIFILDEATASVDPFTEAQIQEGLETVMRDRTAIVIAHRLSTVKNADRIIVMDHGADHRGGQPPRADGPRRALRRAVQHVLPPPITRLPPGRAELVRGGVAPSGIPHRSQYSN